MPLRPSTFFGVAMLLAACASACGSSSKGLTGSDPVSGQPGDDDAGDDSGPSFLTGGDDGGAFVSLGDDGGGACAASSSRGQQQPLDVYIMLDQSISMAGPKWTGVTAAITSFVNEKLSGVSVGLQYFALNAASCNPSDYATAEVEIAPLPGVAAKIMASLAMHVPSTVTPTLAAEQGAIQHAQDWAKMHPGHAVVVILATDGEPDFCNVLPTPVQPVADAAMAGLNGTPKIATFVIGVGTDTMPLDAIAKAGGTGSAFIVDASMNVNGQFLAALDKIRGTALGCSYKIPAPSNGDTVDYAKVNVQFTSGGKTAIFPQVADKGHCPSSGDAWYYDNAANPTQIILCTSSCGSVSTGGTLDVLTGCQTIVK